MTKIRERLEQRMQRWIKTSLRMPAIVVIVTSTSVCIAAEATAQPVAPNSEEAGILAEELNEPVLIADQVDEDREVFANPDGSHTARFAAVPERALVSGDWKPIDLTLATGASGVHPKVAAVDIAFSDGGTGPLARVTDEGEGLAMTWGGGSLPEPSLRGASAIYSDVLPGVDLVLTATVEGFTEELIVRRRQATDLSFNLILDPIGHAAEAKLDAADTLRVVTANGVSVTADTPLMWDSASDGASETPKPVEAVLTPQVGGGQVLTLTADGDYLAAPTTTYPVVVDPSPNLGFQGDTYVDSATPGTAYWSSYDLKIGKLTSGDQRRTFIKYDTASIPTGADISSATLQLYETWAPSCTPRDILIKRVSGNLPDQPSTSWWTRTGSIAWSNQPPLATAVWARASAAKGFSSSCPDGWVSVAASGDGGYGSLSAGCPDPVSLCVGALVQSWVDGTFPNLGLSVTADLTTDVAGKRFASANSANGPPLSVTYVDPPPSVPVLQQPSADVLETQTPVFSGVYNDTPNDRGRVVFEVFAVDVPGFALGALVRTVAPSSFVSGGAVSTATVSPALPLGAYELRARSVDSDGNASNYTQRVDFALDTAGDIDLTGQPGMGSDDGVDLGTGTSDPGPEEPADNADATFHSTYSWTPTVAIGEGAADVMNSVYSANSDSSSSANTAVCANRELRRYTGPFWQHRTAAGWAVTVDPIQINVLYSLGIVAQTNANGSVRGNKNRIRELRIRQIVEVTTATPDLSHVQFIQVGLAPIPLIQFTTNTSVGERSPWAVGRRRLKLTQQLWSGGANYAHFSSSLLHPLLSVGMRAMGLLDKPIVGYRRTLTTPLPQVPVTAALNCKAR